MDRMSKPMNRYPAQSQSNDYYDQSYTYSHYYQNKKINTSPKNPISSNYNENPRSQNHPNFNSRNTRNFNQNNPLNYNKNNTPNFQSKTNSNLQFNKENKNKTNDLRNFEEESLLLNDVYRKTNRNSNDSFSENEKNRNIFSSTNSNNSSPDFSALFNMFLQNINQTNHNSSQNNSENSTGNDFNFSEIPDIETLLKFKKIFERFQTKNSNNEPITNLLYAIKPFMQESKKSIIDQIVKFITISSVLQEFNGLF